MRFYKDLSTHLFKTGTAMMQTHSPICPCGETATAVCDICDEPVCRDCISTFQAYGIETSACDFCREGE